jgi:hypothetical protein
MFITGRITTITIAAGVPKRSVFLALNTGKSEKAVCF